MASSGNKDPIGNLMDTLCSLFGSSDHLKNKTALALSLVTNHFTNKTNKKEEPLSKKEISLFTV